MYFLRGLKAVSTLIGTSFQGGSRLKLALNSSPVEGLCGEFHSWRSYAKLVSFPLAQTGEGISECELIAWAIKAGDVVAPFDKLCDVQSDKAAIEITSRYGGRVVALHHTVGSVVKVGAPLVDLEVADDVQVAAEHLASSSSLCPTDVATPTPSTSKHQANITPTINSNTTSLAPDGDGPAAADAKASSQQAAATPVAAPQLPPKATNVAAAAGHASPTVPAGGMTVAAPGAAPPQPASASQPAAPLQVPRPSPPPAAQLGLPVHASPAVRALARELSIDLSAVTGTGPGGRVTKADVLQHKEHKEALSHPSSGGQQLQQQPLAEPLGDLEAGLGEAGAIASASAGASSGLAAGGVADGAAAGQRGIGQRSLAEAAAQYQRLVAATAAAPPPAGTTAATPSVSQVVPLRGYRRAMVKSMTAAAALPVFHFHDEVAMDRLLAVREAVRSDPGLAAQGIRLTVLPLIVKALSAALLQHPHLNASMAPGGTDLLVHPHHNIGVAMATPTGLVVPNIKQVQRKSVIQIATELSLLQQLAAAGRVPQEALAGGTISISNIGTIGGTYATPIINPPEVAIVALGRLQVLPRYPPEGAAAAASGRAGAWGSAAAAAAAAAAQMPVPVSVMPISWGADHRVVDGAALAAFSNTWKALLEQPEKLLLSLA